MSDIIQDAKRLLEEATPGPWEWETRHYYEGEDRDYDMLWNGRDMVLESKDTEEYASWIASTPEDKRLVAAAPELAQALAEETWEYIVQVKRDDQWQFYIGESRLPTDKPGLANGFSKIEHALEFSKMETEYPTRIVRRRVSPPEVINE